VFGKEGHCIPADAQKFGLKSKTVTLEIRRLVVCVVLDSGTRPICCSHEAAIKQTPLRAGGLELRGDRWFPSVLLADLGGSPEGDGKNSVPKAQGQDEDVSKAFHLDSPGMRGSLIGCRQKVVALLGVRRGGFVAQLPGRADQSAHRDRGPMRQITSR